MLSKKSFSLYLQNMFTYEIFSFSLKNKALIAFLQQTPFTYPRNILINAITNIKKKK